MYAHVFVGECNCLQKPPRRGLLSLSDPLGLAVKLVPLGHGSDGQPDLAPRGGVPKQTLCVVSDGQLALPLRLAATFQNNDNYAFKLNNNNN
jgi:hypothetical protein